MNLKLLGCIAMGVFVAHLAIVMMVFRVRTMNQPSAPLPPASNFRVAQEIVINPATKEKTVYREITVSTALRPELYVEKTEPPDRK